jgi:DNA/RNA endonuclease G (NUC1)
MIGWRGPRRTIALWGCDARHDQFRTDHNLAPGKRAVPDDYDKTGWDQGHGFPDMSGTWAQYESFLVSNMAPPAPGLNRQGWEQQLEADTRAWAVSGLGPLVVFDVPVWSANPKTIGDHHVAVPDKFAKVIYSPVKKQAVAVIMPNSPVAKGAVGMYLVAVAHVERAAGITIPLPADTDEVDVATLWPVDGSGYAKTKKAACAH